MSVVMVFTIYVVGHNVHEVYEVYEASEHSRESQTRETHVLDLAKEEEEGKRVLESMRTADTDREHADMVRAHVNPVDVSASDAHSAARDGWASHSLLVMMLIIVSLT